MCQEFQLHRDLRLLHWHLKLILVKEENVTRSILYGIARNLIDLCDFTVSLNGECMCILVDLGERSVVYAIVL